MAEDRAGIEAHGSWRCPISTPNRLRILLLVGSLAVALPPGAGGGTQDGARILLHVQPPLQNRITACTDSSPIGRGIPCSEFVTAAPDSGAHLVYLVVARGDSAVGIGGVSCGIDYNPEPGQGVDVSTWTLCTQGLEFPNAGPFGRWPEAQGGTRITWDESLNCQKRTIGEDGVHATVGFFYVYVYGPDTLRVVPNGNLESGPELAVGDCEAQVSFLPHEAAGSVVFSGNGTERGCNPCLDPCPAPAPPRKPD